MTISRRDALRTGAALPAAAVLATAATAQTRTGTLPATGRTGVTAAGAMVNEDPLVAAKLLTGGRRQIEVCRVAMEKSQNEKVKAFLKAEIEEHETVKTKVRPLGFEPPMPAGGRTGVSGTNGTGSTGSSSSSSTGSTGSSGTGTGAAGTSGTYSGGTSAAGGASAAGGMAAMTPVMVGQTTFQPPASNMLLVENEIVDQCVLNFRDAINKKQGVKLEKAIVGDQYHAHMGLKDKVTVFKRHASQQMQPILDEALTIINAHIEKCEELMNELDSQKS